MNFENLFNGNKLLSDTTNTFLNENWKAILDELKLPLRKSIGKTLYEIIGNVFDSIPYEEVFS